MERTLRFNGLEWYELIQDKNILIIGAGGIGSWTALFLSRLFEDCHITVMDSDQVEATNLGGQFYEESHIDLSKVKALSQSINYRYGGTIKPIYARYDENQSLDQWKYENVDYVILAVDNMKTRRDVYNNVKICNRFIPFIDGRLLAESYQIFTVSTPEDLERYRHTLFLDSEIPDLVCSAKATTHCAASIGADITGLFINMATNAHFRENLREVPFMISKHFDLMLYDTQIPKVLQAEVV